MDLSRISKMHSPAAAALVALCASCLLNVVYGGDVIGKVVTGYQGWLSAPGDGSSANQWKHTNLECWPDVREYTNTFTGCPFKQAGATQPAYYGNLGNGSPAKIYSAWSDQTVNKHFEWMRQYGGIDCVALQRFGSELGNTQMKDWKNGIAAKVGSAAEAYGRKYYIMYDISGWTNFQSEIKPDWTALKVNHITSPAYAMEGGKPVVCVWGMGFSGRPGNAQSWKDVLDWFKAQGCYVIGGLAQGFQNDSGSYTDPTTLAVTTNQAAFKVCDMVMVWTVGKSSGFSTLYADGINWCNANGKAYQADIYPGTAFYNTNFATDPTATKNKRPRTHGDFMWSQFAAARNKNVQNIYISMFDELQEATQIFKTAEDPSMIPDGMYFLTLDAEGVACSSDFYLRLTKDGADMVKGITPYVISHPTEHIIGGTPPLGNLVLNPSFETGGTAPTSWARGGSAVGSTASAQDGACALRIATAGKNDPTTQTIPIQNGKTYDISVWINASGMTSGIAVFDTADKYDGPGQGQFALNTANAGWTQYSGSFTATTSSVTLRMFTESAFAGTVYFDNIVLAEAPVVTPSVFTWNSAVSGNWSDSSNWTNGGPASAGLAAYGFNFNAAGTYTATHNLNAGFLLNQINLGGSTVTLAGNSLAFVANGPTPPGIYQNSSSAFTLSVPISLVSTVILGGSGAGAMTVSGVISGAGGLTKTTSGNLTISGINTYTGATNVTAGTLTLGASNVLADTMAVAIGSATLDAATFTDSVGTMDVTGGATINLGTGAKLAFANSSAIDWSGGSLNLTGTFVPGSSLRFGLDNTGLTSTQLGLITSTGFNSFALNSTGYLTATPAYAAWLALNAPATGFATDSDNDGIPNGVENVLGSTPNTFSKGLTEVAATATSVTFKHQLNPTSASDVTYGYQWSTDMAEWQPDAGTNTSGTTATIVASTPDGNGVVTVVITITNGPAAKLFGRIVAQQSD